MSLTDRITGRKPVPPPDVAAAEAARNGAKPPVRAGNGTGGGAGRGTPDAPSGTMYSAQHNGEEAPLSTVDQLKVDLHRRLISRLDLDALERIKSESELTSQIRQAVLEFIRDEATPLSQKEREEIVEQVIYEVTGLGPIEPLFRDKTINDILVNGARQIYVERGGKLTRVAASFRNDAHLLAVIDRIVSRVGRRVDEASPMVDARLPDGSRVNAIIPPLALDGPILSIRRFATDLAASHLVQNATLTEEMMQLFEACVKARLNILISGGTGAGKTTFMNALSSFIPEHERVITIEDAAELQLQQEHVVRLETRPPNAEGRGEVVARDLVKNALRMRPDRIIMGEVRSGEALDMLQAMNTGHEGSLTTIHANSPRDALSRLETMILMANANLPNRAMRDQIASALNVIVQLARLSDGTRRVTSVTEITGMEGEVITTQEIFQFRRRGVSATGEVLGRFEATGIRPKFLERLTVAGVGLPEGVFAGLTQ